MGDGDERGGELEGGVFERDSGAYCLPCIFISSFWTFLTSFAPQCMDLGSRDVVAIWRRTGWAAKKSGELKINKVSFSPSFTFVIQRGVLIFRSRQKYASQVTLILATALAVEGPSLFLSRPILPNQRLPAEPQLSLEWRKEQAVGFKTVHTM